MSHLFVTNTVFDKLNLLSDGFGNKTRIDYGSGNMLSEIISI